MKLLISSDQRTIALAGNKLVLGPVTQVLIRNFKVTMNMHMGKISHFISLEVTSKKRKPTKECEGRPQVA